MLTLEVQYLRSRVNSLLKSMSLLVIYQYVQEYVDSNGHQLTPSSHLKDFLHPNHKGERLLIYLFFALIQVSHFTNNNSSEEIQPTKRWLACVLQSIYFFTQEYEGRY